MSKDNNNGDPLKALPSEKEFFSWGRIKQRDFLQSILLKCSIEDRVSLALRSILRLSPLVDEKVFNSIARSAMASFCSILAQKEAAIFKKNGFKWCSLKQ